MDQTDTSKNANISSNNDLSAIELIKDDNPNQNVDLISLIKSDADVVVASQEKTQDQHCFDVSRSLLPASVRCERGG